MASKKLNFGAKFIAKDCYAFQYETKSSDQLFDYYRPDPNKISFKIDRLHYEQILNLATQTVTAQPNATGFISTRCYFNKSVLNQFNILHMFERPSDHTSALHFSDVFKTNFQPTKKTTKGLFSIEFTTKTALYIYSGDWTIRFERNLAIILGIKSVAYFLTSGATYVDLIMKRNEGPVTFSYDLERPIRDLSLLSCNLLNTDTELLFKRFQTSDLCFLFEQSEMGMIPLSSNQFQIENKDIEHSSFYFVNTFNEKVHFTYACLCITLTINCKI